MTPIDEQTARARLKGILSRVKVVMDDIKKEHESAQGNMLIPVGEYQRISNLWLASLELSHVYHGFCGSAQVWLYGADAMAMDQIRTIEDLNNAIDKLTDPFDALDWLCITLDNVANKIINNFEAPQCLQLADTLRALAESGRAQDCDWTNGELRRAYIDSMDADELRQRMIALWSELLFMQGIWAANLTDLQGDYSRGVRAGRRHCVKSLSMVLKWVEAPLGADGRPVEQIERGA